MLKYHKIIAKHKRSLLQRGVEQRKWTTEATQYIKSFFMYSIIICQFTYI